MSLIVPYTLRPTFRLVLGLCLLMATLANAAPEVKVEWLGPPINTRAQEFAPVLSPDGGYLFFVRKDTPENLGYKQNSDDDDIYYVQLSADGTPGPIHHPGMPLNDSLPSAVQGVFPGGNKLLVLNEFFVTKLGPDRWSAPEPIGLPQVYNRSYFRESCLAPNGKVIISAMCDTRTQGFDGNNCDDRRDLYVFVEKRLGEWTGPTSLGNDINTVYNEFAPYLAPDGRTLFFSSDRPGGFGDNDIYRSVRLDDTWTKWSPPENLGEPFNTPGWEAYFALAPDGRTVYTSRGHDDERADILKIVLPDTGYIARSAKPVVLKGKVSFSQGNPVGVDVVVFAAGDKLEREIAYTYSDPVDGSFSLVLPRGAAYQVYPRKGTCRGTVTKLDLTGRNPKTTLNLTYYPCGDSLPPKLFPYVIRREDAQGNSYRLPPHVLSEHEVDLVAKAGCISHDELESRSRTHFLISYDPNLAEVHELNRDRPERLRPIFQSNQTAVYFANAEENARFDSLLCEMARLLDAKLAAGEILAVPFVVEGYASPEGQPDLNLRLARERTTRFADYLRKRIFPRAAPGLLAKIASLQECPMGCSHPELIAQYGDSLMGDQAAVNRKFHADAEFAAKMPRYRFARLLVWVPKEGN